MLYEIKVELREIEPPIWRIIRVPSRTSLLKFHRILQLTMGWKNYHQHVFRVERKRYREPGTGQDVEVPDSHNMTLENIFSRGTKSLVYYYDMGDGWEHKITLLGTVEGEEKIGCTVGARACPPEDCGGPPGYYQLLVALSDPDHEDHDAMVEWVGGKFDPNAFDVASVNKALKRLR